MTMRVGSAPVSWGITEVRGLHSDLPYSRVMDEIRQAGYEGTELGPWGFYPTTPQDLRAELDARSLTLVAAFVDVPMHDPALFYLGREAVKRTAPLLAELGAASLILSAQGTPDRSRIAGRVTEVAGLTAGQWSEAGAFLQELAHMVSDTGLTATFHHHAGTYVETPQEIDRLFNEVDTGLLGLCLDTGHLAYGGGDNMAVIARYGTIIRHVHLKNIDPTVLKRVQSSKLGYVEAVRAGVFCPLDTGSVDIPAVIGALKKLGYAGWLVVEQDIDLASQGRELGHIDPMIGATQARKYLRKVLGA
jgi:inosose dehydratase